LEKGIAIGDRKDADNGAFFGRSCKKGCVIVERETTDCRLVGFNGSHGFQFSRVENADITGAVRS
jgi:hypothetical protein